MVFGTVVLRPRVNRNVNITLAVHPPLTQPRPRVCRHVWCGLIFQPSSALV